MAVTEKRTHFGRAGEFFATSELLLRGWNVAVPVVDVGDDVFVIDDNDKTTFRLQVKSTLALDELNDATVVSASFTLSRSQLWTPQPIELLYMLMIRVQQSWRVLTIPREALHELHREYLDSDHSGPGRPPKTNEQAKTGSLTLKISLEDEPRAWGMSLAKFESWPDELPLLQTGPGSMRGRS